MTQDDLLYRFRLRTFAIAAELGNVRAACRAVEIHPSTAAGTINAYWFSVPAGVPMAPMCCIPRCWWCCRCLLARWPWPRGEVVLVAGTGVVVAFAGGIGLTHLRVVTRLL